MPVVLRREEVVTLRVLSDKGESKVAIAQKLGVSEGTVRYHLKRAAEGAEDGRKNKPFKAEEWAGQIAAWVAGRKKDERPVNVLELWEHLRDDHECGLDYRAVLRYVRAHYPKPKIRTYRRVETPAGAQSQTDWGEYPRVDVGEGPEPLHAFVMVLSHSRMPAMVWSRSEDQVSWLHCHNEAYRRLGGVAAVNRIDNVKTAISKGAGAWGEVNPAYRAYARAVGFHIDACAPRQAQAKGKVEAKVRLGRLRADPGSRRFDSLEALQAWTDRRLERWGREAICSATGLTVKRAGTGSWSIWPSCLFCPSRSMLPSPVRCTRTAWCASRAGPTRCPSSG